MRHPLLVLVCFAILVHASGCSFHIDPCETDDDCPEGNVCHRPAGTEVPVCLDATSTTSSSTSEAVDEEPPEPSTGPSDEPDVTSSAGVCSPSTCGSDEPNDGPREAVVLTQIAAGCNGFDLEPWRTVRRDDLCGGDVDTYAIDFFACDDETFEITVELETPEQCSAGSVMEVVGGRARCGDRNVRCVVEDHVETLTITVPPRTDAHMETLTFTVTGDGPAPVNYIIRARVE